MSFHVMLHKIRENSRKNLHEPITEEPDSGEFSRRGRYDLVQAGGFANEQDDEPIYQSIRSENRTMNDHADVPTFEETPDFSNFKDLPRGERERRLFEEHQRYRQRQSEAPPLPERSDYKKPSKTCVVM